MRQRSRSQWRTLDEVICLIELLLDCHPQGLNVLLGRVPPPSAEEVHAMMSALREHGLSETRSASASLTSEAERIVWDGDKFAEVAAAAGGWPHITQICREFSEAAPKTWAVVADHVKYILPSASRLDTRLDYLARKHGVTKKTVIKYRYNFPFELARAILLPPSDGDLVLRSW